MVRFCLFVAAIFCSINNPLYGQQTYHETLRARLEQPLVAPKPLLFWVERLSHPDADVRQEAIQFLDHEVELTGVFDPPIDAESVERQSAFRSQARTVLPVLLNQLRNGHIPLDEPEVADSPFFTAIYLLMAMRADAAAAIPDLKAIALDATNPYAARMQSVMALFYIVPEDRPVGPLFVDVLNSMPADIQKEIGESYKSLQDEDAYVVGSIGIVSTYYTMNLIHSGHTKSEVPTLVKVASGNYPAVYRAIAIAVLADLSFDARAAVPELRKLLKDKDPFIRELAVGAILMIEDDETLMPELLALLKLDEKKRKECEQELKDYFRDRRNEQAELREWQPDEIQTWLLPEIKSTFRHGSGIQRRQIIQMLGDIGPNAKDALPELRKALQDPDEDTRRMAAEAIRMIENK